MDIIVDGYNLIAFDQGLRGDLERKRNWLAQQLASYQRLKGFAVTVVFDAWNTPSSDRGREPRHGINVLYSRFGEKADDVVVRLARAKGSSCVVVSSDREVQKAVEKFGAVAIRSCEFADILYSLSRPGGGDELDITEDRGGNKRGNPRRLSKIDRKRQETLRKLRL